MEKASKKQVKSPWTLSCCSERILLTLAMLNGEIHNNNRIYDDEASRSFDYEANQGVCWDYTALQRPSATILLEVTIKYVVQIHVEVQDEIQI